MPDTVIVVEEPVADKRGDLARSRGVTNPLVLLETCIAKGSDPEYLAKLTDMVERWQLNEAKDAFGKALSRFQQRCAKVEKKRQVADRGGKDLYKFADYSDVMAVAGPLLADCGLAVRFRTEDHAKGMKGIIRVSCGMYHEDSELIVPVPQVPNANSSQCMIAGLAYMKRALLCLALNIVCGDETDDDGASQYETISQEQAKEVADLIAKTGSDPDRFMVWAGCKELEQMSVAKYGAAVKMLKAKGGAK